MKKPLIERAKEKLDRGNRLFDIVEHLLKENKQPPITKQNLTIRKVWGCVATYAQENHYGACVQLYKLLRLSMRRRYDQSVADQLKTRLRQLADLFVKIETKKQNTETSSQLALF